MSVAYGKGPKGKATRLHSLVVRARGACEYCGRTEGLECAHIIGRRYAATRTDENNAFALCHSCHRRFTEWPMEFTEFVFLRIGEDGYQALREKAQAGVKATDDFWKSECVRLASLLERIEAA